MGYVKLVKFKGRLPDVDVIHQSPQSIPSPSSQQKQLQQKQQLPAPKHDNIKSTQNQQNSDMTNAISAITILIHNTQQTMERSISSKFGEFQKSTFQQNRQFQNTVQSLERSIECVNENLNVLRKEINTLAELQKSSNETHMKGGEENSSNQDVQTDDKEVGKEENDSVCNNISNDNDDRGNDKGVPDESDRETTSIVELIEKMQNEHKREIKEMLEEERKQILQEMDIKRDEFVKQIIESISKEKLDDEKSDRASSDDTLKNDDPNKGSGTCIVDTVKCISLPAPSSLPVIQIDGTSIEMETEAEAGVETETEIPVCVQTATNNIS